MLLQSAKTSMADEAPVRSARDNGKREWLKVRYIAGIIDQACWKDVE